MDILRIEGGHPLSGSVRISGSKNASLPLLAASLLTDEPCTFRNVPQLRDTVTMMSLLRSLGKKVEVRGGTVRVTAHGACRPVAEYDLVSTMRGSFCVLGPLLARYKKARVSLPGGCVIGVRPVDLHLKGLRRLGAKMDFVNGYVEARCRKLTGHIVYLGGAFGSSVLATANLMMAAVLAEGETVIEAAACEPEIQDCAECLNAMGARITGHGTPTIQIQGVKSLRGVDFTVGPDRIEAGTFLLLAVATRSELMLSDVQPRHLTALWDCLKFCGARLELASAESVIIRPPRLIRPVSVTTNPYPGFPTDLQAQLTAVMALASGVSVVTERVFPDRFMHIAELNRMGAYIRREGYAAIIQGVPRLFGASVMASDLRASAALVVAGCAAKGVTEIQRVYHLDRGYERLDEKLRGLGAKVRRLGERKKKVGAQAKNRLASGELAGVGDASS